MPRKSSTFPISFFLLSSLFIQIALYPASAEACDCPWPASPSVEMEKSKAVFLGRLQDVQEKEESFTHKDLKDKTYQTLTAVYHYRFNVEKSWKGAPDKTITLSSFMSDCMWPFEKSRLYLVYAFKGDFDLETNACTRTREAKEIEIERRFLDLGVQDKPENEIFNEVLKMIRTEPFSNLRLQALDFLGQSLPDTLPENFVEGVVEAFQDKSQRVRARAASLFNGIRYHGHPKVKTALAGMLQDEWYTVRIAASDSLRGVTPVGDEQVIAALKEALKQEKIKIRKVTLLREPNRRVIRSFAKSIAKIGGPLDKKAVFPYFLQDLSDKDDDIRHEAVVYLGTFGKLAEEAVPQLIEIYKNATRDRKKITGTVLRNIGTPEAKKALVN